MKMSVNSDSDEKETQAIKMIFPWKLHELLKQVEEKNHNDIISWTVDGKSFIVHDKERFTEEVTPKYFVIQEGAPTSMKFKTFQRSLNLWGFKCVSSKDATGVKADSSIRYAHSCFDRANPDLCLSMKRIRVKGIRRRPCVRKSCNTTTTKTNTQKSTLSSSKSNQKDNTIGNQFLSGIVESSTTTKNNMKENDNVKETKNSNEIFPWKLQELLQQVEDQSQNDIISWSADGKSFVVYDKERFSQEIVPTFFVLREESSTNTKFKMFQRSLNLWGFKCCSRQEDTRMNNVCYSHPYFVRQSRELCLAMKQDCNQGFRRRPALRSSSSTTSCSTKSSSQQAKRKNVKRSTSANSTASIASSRRTAWKKTKTSSRASKKQIPSGTVSSSTSNKENNSSGDATATTANHTTDRVDSHMGSTSSSTNTVPSDSQIGDVHSYNERMNQLLAAEVLTSVQQQNLLQHTSTGRLGLRSAPPSSSSGVNNTSNSCLCHPLESILFQLLILQEQQRTAQQQPQNCELIQTLFPAADIFGLDGNILLSNNSSNHHHNNHSLLEYIVNNGNIVTPIVVPQGDRMMSPTGITFATSNNTTTTDNNHTNMLDSHLCSVNHRLAELSRLLLQNLPGSAIVRR